MKMKTLLAGLLTSVALTGTLAQAAELSIVSGDTGTGLAFLQSELDIFQEQTGHTVTIVPMPSSTSDQFGQYRLWLAAGNADIDVYQTDVIWAPQLAEQFVDLSEAAAEVIDEHFPSVIESQTVEGRLVAIPGFTDAPALFYRTDLLEKHGKEVPTTWAELRQTAQEIMDAERAEGNAEMWGFVFQGNAYEGLTCNALEWVKSYGGGQIVEADGTISINNPQAVAALEAPRAGSAPSRPQGNLAYQEEESRGVWQLGNAVFMRNWPYAYALSNGEDAAVYGNFDVAPLPAGDGEGAKSSARWAAGTSPCRKYSAEPGRGDRAGAVPRLGGIAEAPRHRAEQPADRAGALPGRRGARSRSVHGRLGRDLPERRAASIRPDQANYNEVSSLFWSAVHDTLSGNGSAAENLEILEVDLEDLLN
jgi:trehalose/maltose transport system substrate-binding protein